LPTFFVHQKDVVETASNTKSTEPPINFDYPQSDDAFGLSDLRFLVLTPRESVLAKRRHADQPQMGELGEGQPCDEADGQHQTSA
jgi:hypothetical protein